MSTRANVITWKGGWGLYTVIPNIGTIPISIDFDRVSLILEDSPDKKYHIPFSLQYPSSCSIQTSSSSQTETDTGIAFVIPLEDLDFPKGSYPVSLQLEKKSQNDENSYIVVHKINIPYFHPPVEEPVINSKLKIKAEKSAPEDDKISTLEIKYVPTQIEKDYDFKKSKFFHRSESSFFDGVIKCFYTYKIEGKSIFINVTSSRNTSNSPTNFAGNLYLPDLKGKYGREYTALDRLKITIEENGTENVIYHPFPVFFSLDPGKVCSFSFCAPNIAWNFSDPKIEIEHLVNPDGIFGNFASRGSKLIFEHLDKTETPSQ